MIRKLLLATVIILFSSFNYFTSVNADTVSITALPTNPVVSSGSATFNQNVNKLTINQSSNQLITNWSSFNIGRNAGVEFVQPSASSSALNHVNSSDPSHIYGTLQSNGQVILINPNGVIFNGSSRVDVGSIIASSLAIQDADFLNNNYVFEKDGVAGNITNNGTINAFAGGAVALISNKVSNNGTISADQGSVALLSGDKVTLTLNGNSLVSYDIDQGTLDSFIENNNAIKVGSGQVILSAKALEQIRSSVVNNSGTIEAKGLVSSGGKIFLEGDEITVSNTAKLDASGKTGGGKILVGGSWQNSDTSIRQSIKTTVESGAILDASANETGNGGEIVAWSDIKNSQSSTKAYGTFLAKGGASSGDGGRIETSGYLLDVDNIQVDASSTNGDAGLWLLDPYNITIGTSESGTSYANSFTASATSNILASDISSALVNNNVSISTGTDDSDSSAGVITVSNAISKASGAEKTLTLDGNRNIVLNANISGASGSPLNVIISTGSGALTGASNLVLEGGDLSIEAGGDGTYSGVFSGAGNLTKTGDGTQTLSGTNTYTGTTSVDNGVLAISNAAGLGATDGATTVANAAALNILGGINVAEAITISGSGVSNNGVIRSTSGNNTLSGQITISAHAQIQSDANTLTLNVASSSSITASNKNITFDGAGNITVADPIATGSGTLTKTGSGTLTLSAANTYTGATTISAGVAAISNNTSFGTTDAATTIASGAALNVSGGVTVAEAITINGTGVSSNGAIRSTSGDNTFSGLVTLGAHSEIQSDANTLTLNVSSGNAITGTYNLTFDGSGDTTVNDPIATGSGTLTKAGSGTLLLEGTNTYTGTTTVSAGTLTVSGTLANTALTVSSGATYDVDATDTILSIAGAGTINLADAALTAGDGNDQTFSGTFVGDEKFTKAGAGTLTLSGNSSSFTGIIAISAGDISISNDNNLGNPNTIDADRLTFSGGDLVVTGNVTLNANRGITLSNAATFTVPSDTTLTISGIITSSGTLNKAGAGTLTLGGINTYSGTTNVDAGIVRVANAYGLGATGNGTVVDDGAALEFFNNSGNTIQFRAEPVTINGTGISNGGAIRSIQGNNKFLGTITIGADTRINSDTESNLFEIASSGNITGTGLDIIFGGAGDIKVDDPINTGSGGKVTKDGSGELEISAASNYTGLVTVSAGTLTAANNTALGTIAGGVTVASGAILNLREGITVGNEALALVGSTLTNETSASWTAGYGGGNTNTYQGVITLTGNSTINSDYGTLTINSGGSITSASNHNITVGGGGAININDPISIGAGSITKVGGGVVQLQQNNTYSGGTVLTAGTLAPYAIGAIGSDITFNGGAIRHYSTNTAELYAKYIQPLNGKSWRIDPGGNTVNYSSSEVFNDVGWWN